VAFSAFGLAVTAAFPVPGVEDSGPVPGRAVSVELVDARELIELWSEHEPTLGSRGEDRVILHDEELGHLLDLPDAGRFSISADGRLIRCAPLELDAWRWQRGLFAGALPFAALVQGIEVFHAAAVGVHGRLVAITAESGGGKSTLATFLRLAGASFFTDDVLALEVVDDRVMAHPGPPLQNVRHSTAELLSAPEREALGAVLGADDFELRLGTEAVGAPALLADVYFLERNAEREALSLEPVESASRWLLGASYNFVIRTPQRLLSQLDLCSRLAEDARLTRIAAPATLDPRLLAEAVIEDVESAR
jgi:hypothetical protein